MGSFSQDGSAQDGSEAGLVRLQHEAQRAPSSIQRRSGQTQPSGDDSELRVDLLIRAIEYEIIPRLMQAHRTSDYCELPGGLSSPQVSEAEVDSFTAMVIEPSEDILQAQIDAMRSRGVSVEALYLDLLTPVARRLGTLWEQDLCSFSDVTIGLGRLQQILRELSRAFGETTDRLGKGMNILLVPCPGEQHSFGLVMVGEFFRRAGWHVTGGPAVLDPVALVAKENFDVVGLSMAADIFRAEMASCIRNIRRATKNSNLVVLVGGPAFLANPGLVAELRADAMATDGREAPRLIETLITERRASRTWSNKI